MQNNEFSIFFLYTILYILCSRGIQKKNTIDAENTFFFVFHIEIMKIQSVKQRTLFLMLFFRYLIEINTKRVVV